MHAKCGSASCAVQWCGLPLSFSGAASSAVGPVKRSPHRLSCETPRPCSDDIDEEMIPIFGRRRGSSILSLLRGSGGSGLSALGELADEHRLGELPTEDDLRAIFIDPLGLSQAAEGSGSGTSAAAAAAACSWQPGSSAAAADLPPAIIFQQAGLGGSLYGHIGGQVIHRMARPAAMPAQQVQQQVPSAAHEGGTALGSDAGVHSAGLAKLKRRVDRLDLEALQEGSPRKRHSSEAAWSDSRGGSDSEGSCEEGPGSWAQRGMSREQGAAWPVSLELFQKRLLFYKAIWLELVASYCAGS